MSLVTDPKEVEEIYDLLREKNVCLPTFCTESPRMTEAILRTFHQVGKEWGIKNPPAVVAFTASYPYITQCADYTYCRNTYIGFKLIMDDIKRFVFKGGPYSDLRVMVHLDHAQPEADQMILKEGLEDFATVMYDCSTYSMEENIKRTARFVEQTKNKIRVEGAVDEISVTGKTKLKGHITSVEMAERFVKETGAYLIVPNLGTEQQSTKAEVRYNSQRAKEISGRVGKKLVLHGTSCLTEQDLVNLAGDGIIRTNIWTSLEKAGAKALAMFTVEELGNIISEDDRGILDQKGLLGPRHFNSNYQRKIYRGWFGSKLPYITERHRAKIWLRGVEERMRFYLHILGYQNLA